MYYNVVHTLMCNHQTMRCLLLNVYYLPIRENLYHLVDLDLICNYRNKPNSYTLYLNMLKCLECNLQYYGIYVVIGFIMVFGKPIKTNMVWPNTQEAIVDLGNGHIYSCTTLKKEKIIITWYIYLHNPTVTSYWPLECTAAQGHQGVIARKMSRFENS